MQVAWSSPPGAVIAPASSPKSADKITSLMILLGGALEIKNTGRGSTTTFNNWSLAIVPGLITTASSNGNGMDQDANGVPDVDYALTTRELARMIKEAGIDFANLADGAYDRTIARRAIQDTA